MTMPVNVSEFFKQFPDDSACLEHLMNIRFGNPIDCPKCGRHGRYSRIKKIPAYQCAWCGHHIHPMAGTPFGKTRTPLQKWYYAMYLFTTSSRRISARELQRQLSVTYKTAWRIGNELRKYMCKVNGGGGTNGPTDSHKEVHKDEGGKSVNITGNEFYIIDIRDKVFHGINLIRRIISAVDNKTMISLVTGNILV